MAFVALKRRLFCRQILSRLKVKVPQAQFEIINIEQFQRVRSGILSYSFLGFYESYWTIHTSARIYRIWEVPTQTEADYLKNLYANPRGLLQELIRPLVQSGLTTEACVTFSPKLRGQFWRAKLNLEWPRKVTIAAVSTSMDQAEENVYLLACDLFKNMGLLYLNTSGQMCPVCPEYAISMLQALHSQSKNGFRSPFKFSLISRPSVDSAPATAQSAPASDAAHLEDSNAASSYGDHAYSPPLPCCSTSGACQPDMDRSQVSSCGRLRSCRLRESVCKTTQESPTGTGQRSAWTTDVSVSWPYPFSVTSRGPAEQVSQYTALLLSCIKLKALGLLSNNNHLRDTRKIKSLSRRNCEHLSPALFPSKELFNPHYEIYSDASARGFGAYLLKRDERQVHWLSNSWSEHFPDSPFMHPRQKLMRLPEGKTKVQLDSFFCEFYSVVSACYTWKHRFIGKRVMVWTDNQHVAHIVNKGIKPGRRDHLRVEKLYNILADTCVKHAIRLCASHVQRSENTAADLLSRCDLMTFKDILPEAAPSMKKTKKLLFWNPLQAPVHPPQQL